jgi:hypothetical protein
MLAGDDRGGDPMDWLSFDYKHSVNLEEAVTKLAAASKMLGATYNLEVTRKKRRVDVDGKILRGHFEVHKKKVSVSIVLVGPVTPSRTSVAAAIRKALDRQFG